MQGCVRLRVGRAARLGKRGRRGGRGGTRRREGTKGGGEAEGAGGRRGGRGGNLFGFFCSCLHGFVCKFAEWKIEVVARFVGEV
jgi:hypothetical protein